MIVWQILISFNFVATIILLKSLQSTKAQLDICFEIETQLKKWLEFNDMEIDRLKDKTRWVNNAKN